MTTKKSTWPVGTRVRVAVDGIAENPELVGKIGTVTDVEWGKGWRAPMYLVKLDEPANAERADDIGFYGYELELANA